MGKLFTKRSQQKKPWYVSKRSGFRKNLFTQIGNYLVRSHMNEYGMPTVQEIIDAYRGTRLDMSKCLVKIDNTPYLPNYTISLDNTASLLSTENSYI